MAIPGFEPYQQGRFDGLCSVYALINAVHVSYPTLEDAAAEDLFHFLIKVLQAHSLPLSTVSEGIDHGQLRQLAANAEITTDHQLSEAAWYPSAVCEMPQDLEANFKPGVRR